MFFLCFYEVCVVHATMYSSGFAVGKNLAIEETSSSDSLPIQPVASPAGLKTRRRLQDLRIIRHFAKTNKVTLKEAVESIGMSIMKVAKDNDKLPCAPSTFDAVRPPNVDLVWYLWRLVNDLNAAKEPILFKNDGSSVDLLKEELLDRQEGLKFDDSAMGRGLRCLLFALVYVDRITQKTLNFRVNSFNVHRVMLGTMYEAHKFSDDAPFKLSYFALLGGVSMQELKKIEVAVCLGLQFEFYISEWEFHSHSLAQLNLAVKGSHQRKLKQKHQAKAAVAQVLDHRRTLEEHEYGLGGSTPLLSTSIKRT